MRTTNKRVAVPFLFRAADALGANGNLVARVYGNEVEGVFTRANKATHAVIHGGNWRLSDAPHSGPRLGRPSNVGAPAGTPFFHALLLEVGTTNLVEQSEDFSAWSNSSVTVTTNAVQAPDGTTTADLLDATASTVDARYRTVAFTGDGTKSASVWFRSNTSSAMGLGIYDSSAATMRALANVTAGGVGTIESGSGTVRVEPWESPDGTTWYRVLLTANSIVAANTNQIYLYPDRSSGTGSVYAWGAQAEDLTVPSAYIKTTGATVARAADALYFPFTLAPQGMTVYIRGYERGTALSATDRGLFGIGGATNAAFFVDGRNGGAGYASFHRRAGDVSSVVSNTVAYGDLVEVRAVLATSGTTTCGVAINGAAEVTGSTSAVNALATSWAASRLYLGDRNGTGGQFAFTHACVALGTKTMAEMRVLAEVG